jgi:hypothetical protein
LVLAFSEKEHVFPQGKRAVECNFEWQLVEDVYTLRMEQHNPREGHATAFTHVRGLHGPRV